SALAARVTASIAAPSAGMNVRCPSSGSRTQPAISATCRAIITGKWLKPYSTPPRRSSALACRADTTSSAILSHAMTDSSVQYTVMASPPQQQKLGAHAGPESDHEPERSRRRRFLRRGQLKDVQHRDRRHVA